LRDAIKRPNRVGDYKLEFYQVKETGQIIQIHKFRFCPSTAACTKLGARNASDVVILT
jgi:hypothetical protein